VTVQAPATTATKFALLAVEDAVAWLDSALSAIEAADGWLAAAQRDDGLCVADLPLDFDDLTTLHGEIYDASNDLCKLESVLEDRQAAAASEATS
jgi:hypothetical protein